jgi:hypothetical protein
MLFRLITRIIFLKLVFFCGFVLPICSQSLSEQAQVSLLTETSGRELYLAFGHSQIRITDPQSGLDVVYNYGVFDLRQPDFYTKFMKGRLEYLLAAYPAQYAFQSSQEEGRGQTEQVLNLTYEQKKRLFDFLNHNALPENRTYLYDYFYDNCSSHIRDIFDKILGDSLKWDYSTSANPSKPKDEVSIRDYMNDFLNQTKNDYGRLSLDILLGLPTDKVISPKEEMYLPYYLMYHLDKAKVKTANGWEPFVKSKKELINHTLVFENPVIPSIWLFSGILIAGIALTFWQWQTGNTNRMLDGFLFLLTGLLGLLITFLWFFTDHKAASGNLNILWAMPFNLAAFAVIFSRKWVTAWKWYFAGYAGLLGLLLVTWAFLPQDLNNSLIPLVILLAIRSLFLYRISVQKK